MREQLVPWLCVDYRQLPHLPPAYWLAIRPGDIAGCSCIFRAHSQSSGNCHFGGLADSILGPHPQQHCLPSTRIRQASRRAPRVTRRVCCTISPCVKEPNLSLHLNQLCCNKQTVVGVSQSLPTGPTMATSLTLLSSAQTSGGSLPTSWFAAAFAAAIPRAQTWLVRLCTAGVDVTVSRLATVAD